MAYTNASTLGYLSSTQALADYANLIVDLKNNLSAIDSPVVVFGGSYGGSMSNIDSVVFVLLFTCYFFFHDYYNNYVSKYYLFSLIFYNLNYKNKII